MVSAVKLLMTWDILPGQAQEYFEFIVRDFLPGMQKLGVEPTDAWYTAYGDGPQIMVGGISPSPETMAKFLRLQRMADHHGETPAIRREFLL